MQKGQIIKQFFTILLIPFLLISTIKANQPEEQYRLVINLEGQWKLMIGDDMERMRSDFDDRHWETVQVPSSWESHGFHGYDGYAWYRKKFVIPGAYKDASLMLILGYIDDVDETYVNGTKVGHKGSFPPNYWTAYNAERKYIIPDGVINFDGNNTIAVRVYDSQIDGGIVKGEVGIYQRIRDLVPDIDLDGYWNFQTGDNMEWAESGYDHSHWNRIVVPGIWEDQFAKHYDGFAWYRRRFKVPGSRDRKRYVLMLGKIDDIDEVYINGKRVAHTGKMQDQPSMINVNDEYSRNRYYYLDEEDVVSGKINTIAIRVFDKGGEGGIYEGPVGLIELRRFIRYWRSR